MMALAIIMVVGLIGCGQKDSNIEILTTEQNTVGENTLETNENPEQDTSIDVNEESKIEEDTSIDTNEESKTEEDTHNAIDANEGSENKEEVKVVYKEYDNYYLITNDNMYGKKYVDGERIKEGKGYTNPIWQNITINDEIKLYNVMKYEVGYTKDEINAILIETYGQWTFIDVYNEDTAYAVRTDELNKAMAVATENTSNTSEKNETSETEKNEEPTYTIKEMSATKYAKQSVNIRKGPSTDYEKIGSLTMNQKVTVTGQADNGWYRISYNGGDAYVSGSYLVNEKITIETTTNNGGNSESKNEQNGGNTNNNENREDSNTGGNTGDAGNNNGGGNTTTEPQTPTVNYSASDVVAIIESTLKAAGFNKTTDVMTAEEIAEDGPTAGAGWGDGTCTLDGAVSEAESMIEFMRMRGYNTFYIEVLGMSDGVVTIRFYRCTF